MTMATEIVLAIVFLLLALGPLVYGADTRDGRAWQSRPDTERPR